MPKKPKHSLLELGAAQMRLNARAYLSESLLNEVRDVTVQRVGYEDYIYALLLIRVPDEEDEGVNFYKIASATAEQIARACVEAWEARESPELVK